MSYQPKRRRAFRAHGRTASKRAGLIRLPLLMIALVVAQLAASAVPALAFNPAKGGLPAITIYYKVDANFTQAGFLLDTLYAGEQSWKIQGLTQHGHFIHDPTRGGDRLVRDEFVDGPGSKVANATIGCKDNSASCRMRFEAVGNSMPWNTTREVRSSSWIDLWGTAAHEFGHWYGLDHRSDKPASDGAPVPTMQTSTANNPDIRSIQADDVNGLRTVRQTTNPNMLANGSFEYPNQQYWGGEFGLPGWGFKESGPFFTVGVNCNDVAGRKHGNCYAEFSGNDGAPGTSIFQDVAAYQGDGTNPNYLRSRRSMQFKAFLVDPNPQPGTSTPLGVGHRMQVWAMDTTPHLLLATAHCAVLTIWTECSTPVFENPLTPIQNTWLKVEIINDTPSNMLRVDHARLSF